MAGAAAVVAAQKRALAPEPKNFTERQAAGRTKHERFNNLLAALRGVAPEAFCSPPRPLAIGIDRQIRDLAGASVSKRDLSWCLRWWTSTPAYLAALAHGGPRVNLDGTIAGEVEPSHREHARRELEGEP